MFKVVKTKISEDDFIKEVQELFSNKYTEDGLRVLFYYLNWMENGEYELCNIGKNFEDWTFEKYSSYAWRTYSRPGHEYVNIKPTKESVERFLNELVYGDDWKDCIAGITDNTVMFINYYISFLT